MCWNIHIFGNILIISWNILLHLSSSLCACNNPFNNLLSCVPLLMLYRTIVYLCIGLWILFAYILIPTCRHTFLLKNVSICTIISLTTGPVWNHMASPIWYMMLLYILPILDWSHTTTMLCMIENQSIMKSTSR